MTHLLNNFKLDSWWKIVLLLGVLSIASSMIYVPDFIDPQKLFGLGLGMVIIGMSYVIAEKQYSWIKPPNVYTGPAALITQSVVRHTVVTIPILLIGVAIVCIFAFSIIKNLL